MWCKSRVYLLVSSLSCLTVLSEKLEVGVEEGGKDMSKERKNEDLEFWGRHIPHVVMWLPVSLVGLQAKMLLVSTFPRAAIDPDASQSSSSIELPWIIRVGKVSLVFWVERWIETVNWVFGPFVFILAFLWLRKDD